MPTFKDIRAKNAQFAASARENAGKPRIRAKDTQNDSAEGETFESRRATQQRGRTIVKPAKKDRSPASSSGLKNNKLALALIVFVVCGGLFFELMRLFL